MQEDKTIELKKQFIKIMDERKIRLQCPICGTHAQVLEGPFSKSIQINPGAFVIGGPTIPTMGVICKNCGYVREFALGALGLLDAVKNLSMKENVTDTEKENKE